MSLTREKYRNQCMSKTNVGLEFVKTLCFNPTETNFYPGKKAGGVPSSVTTSKSPRGFRRSSSPRSRRKRLRIFSKENSPEPTRNAFDINKGFSST